MSVTTTLRYNSEPFIKRFSYDGSGNVTYEGTANPGTASNVAAWAIRRFTYTGANVTLIEWANGRPDMENVWDNASSLSYS